MRFQNFLSGGGGVRFSHCKSLCAHGNLIGGAKAVIVKVFGGGKTWVVLFRGVVVGVSLAEVVLARLIVV